MGLFVNPGMGSLLEDMNDDICVDKSLIIAELNKCYGSRRRFVCVSRPRRFGKTMVGNVAQARGRRYADALAPYGGEALIVGVAYDRKTKRHTCKIEKIGD